MGTVKPFVAHGDGYSGDFQTFAEARAVTKTNKNGAVYVLACSCGNNEGCSWCANGNHESKAINAASSWPLIAE